MTKNVLKINKFSVLYWAIIVTYSILIFFNTRYFSPFDDTGFLEAHDNGKLYGLQLINGGRLFPLHGIELHLFRFIFNNDMDFIASVYGFSAIIFILCSYIVYKLLEEINSIRLKILICAFLFILILSPAFTVPFFRMLYAERYLLLIFLILSKLLYSNKKDTGWAIYIIILSTIAILLKEPAAVTILFLGIYLIFTKDKFSKISGVILIFNSIIFFTIYIIFIIPSITKLYSTADGYIPKLIFAVKAIVEWVICDPLIIFLGLTFCVIQTVNIFKSKSVYKFINKESILFILGIVYLLVVLVTNIGYAPHYFTPIYGFLIPAVIVNVKYIKFKKYSYIIVLIFILQIGNITLGINIIISENCTNKQTFIIINKLKKLTTTKKITKIFIVNGADWGGHYSMGLGYFLVKNNVRNIFLCTNERQSISKSHTVLKYKDVDSIYTNYYTKEYIRYYTFNIVGVPKNGDLVLITPFAKDEYKIKPNNSRIIYRSNKKPFFRYLNIKDFLRYVLFKFDLMTNYVRNSKSGVSDNNFVLYKIEE